MPDYKNITTYYDKYGTWYDKERKGSDGYYSFINEIETDIIRKYGTGKRTLEIGCGTGIILEQVNEFAKQAQGIDISEGMLKDSRKKGLKVEVANAAKKLPFKNGEFDVTYSFKVLPHIPELEKALEEMARVTKKGGYVIMEFYNTYSFKHVNNLIARAKKKIWTRYTSLASFKKLMPKNLEIVELVGARIITPVSAIVHLPLVGPLFKKTEKLLSKTPLNRFAGYLTVVAKVS